MAVLENADWQRADDVLGGEDHITNDVVRRTPYLLAEYIQRQ